MTDSVRIRLSWGLIVLAAVHATILAISVFVANKQPSPEPSDWTVPTASQIETTPYGSATYDPIKKLDQPANVNLSAQGEMKQQGCPTCVPTLSRPLYINGERVVRIGPSRTVTKPEPAASSKQPSELFQPQPTPVMPPVTTVSNTADQPEKKVYQLSLFINDDAQSQQILYWFGTQPQLIRLREISDVQVYTPENALYKSRFADIVPVNQFPVVLFTDSTGGHIHAAGRTMIPGSANELWEDLRKGQQLWVQSKEGTIQNNGAIKSKGYSWDDQILPNMRLTANDCPDGNCPSPDTSWRPFDRVRPDSGGSGLFDEQLQKAFVWANGGELATLGLMVLAAFLVFYILIKRGN